MSERDTGRPGDEIGGTKEERSAAAPLVIAAVVGAVSWFTASAMSGRREAWDASLYWMLVYPAAIAVSALLGHQYPARAWRWPVALFAGQFVAMLVRNGELGGLWPLGLLLFGVLALPALLAAYVAARIGRRSAGGAP
ncbi:MAG TPA: hypothetical protein VMK32_07495 [Burkholderiaceae bacterium]|nr:hypothetical protein [Burkholderiaceae bacterium]